MSGLCLGRKRASSVQGTVDRIWQKGKVGGSEFWVLFIDGRRYITRNKNLVANILEGDRVEFTFGFSGHCRELISLKRIPVSPFVTADKLMPSSGVLRQVRMNCLRTASDLLSGDALLPEQKVSLAITIAQKFEGHVLHGTATRLPQQAAEGKHDVEKNMQGRREGRP